jgi:hypothetical protein
VTEDQARRGDTATETHREPHGSASPHGPADDVPGHEPAGGDRVGQDGHGAAGGHGASDAHDSHDAHGEALGPIDVRAWAAGAVGILLGLVVVACLWAATRGIGAG